MSPSGAGRIPRVPAMVVTGWVMTVSTLQLFVIVVLAAGLIADLGLTRWQIGALGAINTGFGALLAPRLGRLADRLGSRRAMIATIGSSAAGLALTAVAVDYWLLVAGSAVAGLPQGAGNPVTNRLIAEDVAPGDHGPVTGVKQSGVQLAVFLSGALLPVSAVAFGWRWVLGAFAVLTLASVALVLRLVPASPTLPTRHRHDGADRDEGRVDPFVRRVAIYAFLLGLAAGGVTRFYPLYAQEVLAFTENQAGLAVSLTGLAAIAGRLAWAHVTDRLISSRSALKVLAIGGAATTGLLLAAEVVSSALLWPAVVLAAFTVVAWNVVAMLAVIRLVPPSQSGRATGVVLMGFLGGLTVSAPVVGYAVDRLDSYRPAWIALGLLALSGAMVVGRGPAPAPVSG